jgi:hypothetical protein
MTTPLTGVEVCTDYSDYLIILARIALRQSGDTHAEIECAILRG